MLRKTAKTLLFILINLLAVEATLRVQQAVGPLYDLEMEDVFAGEVSTTLNHEPRQTETWTLVGTDVYGDRAGFGYEVLRDDLKVRRNGLRPDPAGDVGGVLFLGDSFVEGYDDEHTLVHQAWRFLRDLAPDLAARPFRNAGHSSYSPAILVPQAKRLLAVLDPDYVVIVIDQTDLGDDVLRYERLAVRRNGSIEAVLPSPVEEEFRRGLRGVADSPSYLVRAVRKLHHTRVVMPAFRKGFFSWWRGGVRQYCRLRDSEAGESLQRELAVFGANLDDLLATILARGVPSDRILLVTHPHKHHLTPEADGFLWRDFVGPAVAEAAARHGVAYYDVAADLEREFAGRTADFYWPGDMHFNFEGQAVYGRLLAERLAAMP